MTKSITGIIAIVVIIAGFATYSVIKHHDTTNTPTTSSTATPTPSASASASATATASADATTAAVALSGYAMDPSSITVAVGTKVTWTNKDNTTHTVTGDSGPESLNSQPLTYGQTYSFTFTKAGTYTYHCTFHPYMTGTVIVTAS